MKNVKKLIGLSLLLAQGTMSCAETYLDKLAELQARAAQLGIELEIIDELAARVKEINNDAQILDFLEQVDTLAGRSVTEKQPAAVKTPATAPRTPKVEPQPAANQSEEEDNNFFREDTLNSDFLVPVRPRQSAPFNRGDLPSYGSYDGLHTDWSAK